MVQEALQHVWWVERFFYRHHRPFGVFIIGGSLVMMLVLMSKKFWALDVVAFVLASAPGVRLIAWGLVSGLLMIGLVVLVRPSALKRFEAVANRQVNLVSRGHPDTGAAG